MSNSPLVNYTRISPNSTNPRKDTIKKITIHHMAGNLTVETCGNVFAPESRQASANYAIGTDGRVGMYVEEKNRAWTSSNPDNDNQAITIEVANDKVSEEWHVSDLAFAKLLDLCTDICQRNSIKALNYTGDATGNLTRHNMFAATVCPGPYLQAKFPQIASEVNKRLAGTSGADPQPGTQASGTAGKLYRVRKEKNDASTQIGAFSLLENAKNEADKNKTAGYKVFDEGGTLVYDPNTVPGVGADPALTLITGQAVATVAQMRVYLAKLNANAPDLAALYFEEGIAEGLRGDVAFAQACLETGNFQFGGDVMPEQNNFAGIGATGGGAPGNSFATPQIGVRAQVQHLKAYANNEPLKGECVDPRFKYVERGVAPYVEWLGQKENPQGKGWATGKDYGEKILRILHAIQGTEASAEIPAVKLAEKTPEEITVENAFADGVITDKDYWLGVLNGTIQPDRMYIKGMMDNSHKKLHPTA